MKRLKAAFKTNETQATAVVFMSCLMTIAALTREDANEIPIWVFAVLFFITPIAVLISNFISPLK